MMISVVIPAFNAMQTLPLQLDALAEQSGAPPFEVLIVDNGDNCALPELAESYEGRIPSVRVIPAHDVQGASYARNVGASAAVGDYLLFCDADDVVLPTWVRDGAEVLRQRPVFSGGAVPVSEELCSSGLEPVVAHVKALTRPRASATLSGTKSYPLLMGGSFGIRRKLLLDVGGFDVSFGSASEDNDLAFRLTKMGIDVIDTPHVAVGYRQRGTSATFQQGFRTGASHALLCARHSAWRASTGYRGPWPLRPIRTLLEVVLNHPWHGSWSRRREALGQQVGLVWGRIRYGLNPLAPKPLLGIGLTESGTQQ